MSEDISKSLQKERQLLQAKTFTSWLNYRLEQVPGSPQIVDLFQDLRDGKYLLALLEQLTGQVLKPVKGNMRLHHLNNLAKVLDVLEGLNIKLVGIHNETICDGNVLLTLGLCWSLIYYFQVQHSVDVDSEGGTAEKALLEWCSHIAASYNIADVKSFQPNRWKSGYMLNAIVHSFNPKLFDYEKLKPQLDTERVQHSLDMAYDHYGVPKIFTHSDFENNLIDNKTLILYVSMLKEQMDIFIENQKKEAMTVLERLQGKLDGIRKSVEEKEGSELLRPHGDLSFHESKTFSGQYNVFLKELDSMSSKLGQFGESIKTVEGIPEESLSQLNTDHRDLEHRVKAMKEKCGVYAEDAKQSRIDIVQGKLDKVNKDILDIKTAKDKVMEGLKQDASKEKLEECDHSIKDLLQHLARMQTEVKDTCSLVDKAYADKILPKDARQKLKTGAIKVLEEYANLMGLLEDDHRSVKTLVGDKVKTIEEKFNLWCDEVKDLEVWLDERIIKYGGVVLKYDNVVEMKNVFTEIQALLEEMKGDCWTRFQAIASKWNGELCDEINDDKYADTLSDMQTKFNKLHEVVTGVHALANGMLNQKNGEDDLISKLMSWNLYVDRKENELHEIDLDAENVEKFLEQVETILKDIAEKDNDVKAFLSSSVQLLEANKYDDSVVSEIEGKLKVFCDNWDKLKDAYKEKKMKMDHIGQLRIVQRESERNLGESLLDWKKTLGSYTVRLHDINLKEYSTIEEIKKAVEEIEVLVAEINGHDDALQEYDRDTSTLIDTLEQKNALVLNEDFQQFFKDWEELKAGSLESLSHLNASMDKQIASDDLSMKDWEAKAMLTEELLKVSEEVTVYCSDPSNLDNFDDYLKKFDDLEVKVTNHGDIIDSNIEESKTLLDQLKVQQNKEKVKSSVDAFTQKKTKLLENMVAAKRMAIHLTERQRMQKENREILTIQLSQWQKYLDDNNETLNKCDINPMSNVSETLKAVDMLEELIEQINSIEDQLNEFDTSSQELLSTLHSAKAAQLNGELRLFFKNWDLCQGKATERLSGLKMQLAHLQKNENGLMAEWTSSVLKNILWLEETIEETKLYLSLPEQPFDVQVHLSEFQEMQNKVSVKMEFIKDQKDYGNKLIEDKKVQEEANKGTVLKDVAVIIEKESVIEENLSKSKNLVKEEIRAIVLKKVCDFWDWLPTVQKRSEEGDEIGPDFETVAKQIQEMKIIEGQAMQMSFSGLLDPYKPNNMLDFLTEEEKENLKTANDEWTKIKNWMDKRLATLQKSDDIWDDFKSRKMDLLEYLRDIEKDLKSSTELDLNDTIKVAETTDGLKAVTSGMEARKNHVANLVETADKLITILSAESTTDSEHTLPNSIRSQVADVLDSWNSMVKRSIELKTKLGASHRKFELLQKVFCEVHDWIEDCNDLLIRFTDDVSGVYIDQLRVLIERKQKEEPEMKDKLHEVNDLDEELSRDVVIVPHYTLNGTIKGLNEDFASTCNQLEELRKFPGKVRIFSRRVLGSTRQLTRSLTTRNAPTQS